MTANHDLKRGLISRYLARPLVIHRKRSAIIQVSGTCFDWEPVEQ